MQSSTFIGDSPSFTSHSSTYLADVAARVVQEFRHENTDDYDDIFNSNDYDHDHDHTEFPISSDDKLKDEKNYEDDDDEFEFHVVCRDGNSSTISADEIFFQGHIMPRYPLFDTSLLLDVNPTLIKVVNGSPEIDCKPSVLERIPLRKLFSEERDFGSADDLDGVNPGTYCVWKPKPESGRCKKSNSTGNSSRRWKFGDILYRSNSDGNHNSFLLFKPIISTYKKKINNEKVKKVEKSGKVADGVSENGGSRRRFYSPSGHVQFGALMKSSIKTP